ncbi:MAG: exosortase-associated EpsI family protein [Planctomycetota bacterium]|nr:exosortase-associated EpsI family protein [Planctomycetota bacterium]
MSVQSVPSSARPSRGLAVAASVALAVLVASALGLGSIISALKLQLNKMPIQPRSGLKFHTLPTELAGWKMVRDEVMSAEGLAELGTENYVTRWYVGVDAAGKPVEPEVAVQLHAAYYTGMIDTVPHVPERCLVGGGMEYAGATRTVPVPIDMSRLVPDPDLPPLADGSRVWTARNARVPSRVRLPIGVEKLQMRVTPFRDAQAKQSLFAGYFFLANGGVAPSADDVRLLAFRLQDDYAYYAKIQFLSPTVESAEELAEIAGRMLDDLFPDLMLRVPDWVEVTEGRYPPDNPRGASASAGGASSSR